MSQRMSFLQYLTHLFMSLCLNCLMLFIISIIFGHFSVFSDDNYDASYESRSFRKLRDFGLSERKDESYERLSTYGHETAFRSHAKNKHCHKFTHKCIKQHHNPSLIGAFMRTYMKQHMNAFHTHPWERLCFDWSYDTIWNWHACWKCIFMNIFYSFHIVSPVGKFDFYQQPLVQD